VNDYPANWPEIALAVKAAADWRCVRCRHPHERPGCAVACDDRCRHVKDNKQRVLTVHHLDGDKANCEWWNLAALCQVCHLHVQATYHPDQMPMLEMEPWLAPYYWARHHQGDQHDQENQIRLSHLLSQENSQREAAQSGHVQNATEGEEA
jgi:hypothetical protein